jgi:hypothetical protein
MHEYYFQILGSTVHQNSSFHSKFELELQVKGWRTSRPRTLQGSWYLSTYLSSNNIYRNLQPTPKFLASHFQFPTSNSQFLTIDLAIITNLDFELHYKPWLLKRMKEVLWHFSWVYFWIATPRQPLWGKFGVLISETRLRGCFIFRNSDMSGPWVMPVKFASQEIYISVYTERKHLGITSQRPLLQVRNGIIRWTLSRQGLDLGTAILSMTSIAISTDNPFQKLITETHDDPVRRKVSLDSFLSLQA